MSNLTDEELASLVQQGETEAFAEIVLRYEDKLRRYARRFLSRNEDIDDLVQEVFIKVFEHIQSFDKHQRFSPWVYRIAHNSFVNELKRQSRYPSSFFDPDTLMPYLASKETAESENLAAEINEETEALVGKLPPKYREVIILHYFEDLSYQEISDVLKIPTNTVGVRITRARIKLRELLKEKAYE